jgi:hypothetical protein
LDQAKTTTTRTPAERRCGRHELLAHLHQLYGDLRTVIDRDPEQEILGVALPVVDVVISASREFLTGPDSVLASGLHDLICTQTVAAAEPIRAVDAWIVVGQVLAAIGAGAPPPLIALPPTLPAPMVVAG